MHIRILNFRGYCSTVKNDRIFYAVGRGKEAGIYDSWEACKVQVCGVPHAKFKKFSSPYDAERFVNFWQNSSDLKNEELKEPENNDTIHHDKYSAILKEFKSCENKYSTASCENSSEIKNVNFKIGELKANVLEVISALKSNLISKSDSTPKKRSKKSETTLCSNKSRSNAAEKYAINEGNLSKTLRRITTGKTARKLTISDSPERLKCLRDTERTKKGKRKLATLKKAVDIDLPETIFKVGDFKTALDSSDKVKNEGVHEIHFNFDQDNYVEVYTDGSARFSGKPNARAGLGVWFGKNHPLNLSLAVKEHPTNNLAEIKAAQMAIRLANTAGIKKLKIMTDSSYLLNSITKWIHKWQKNGWISTSKKPIKNKVELENLYRDTQKLRVLWEKVRAHTGVLGNELAHQLASDASKEDKGSSANETK